MAKNSFSIVVPTREGHETLEATLKTCLMQKYDDYEIIVCDNFSAPMTKDIVDRIHSERIKYVRSAERLSMRDNWELALSHASGDYVIIIGDDDGLLLNALAKINEIINCTGVDAVRWERVYYSWPNLVSIPEMAENANKCDIPMLHQNQFLSAKKVIPLIANYKMDYTMLPMLYNSAIKSSLIKTLKSRTGRVFSSIYPDIYSGFAFAYLSQKYLSIGRPMSINAGSVKSNGISTVVLKDDNNNIANEFNKLNSNASRQETIPRLHVIPAILAESFSQAKEHLFADEHNLKINRKLLIENCVKAAYTGNTDLDCKKLAIIRDSLSDDARLQKWFDAKFNAPQHNSVNHQGWRNGFDGRTLHVDAKEFAINDVYGVAELCDKLFERDYKFDYQRPSVFSSLKKKGSSLKTKIGNLF